MDDFYQYLEFAFIAIFVLAQIWTFVISLGLIKKLKNTFNPLLFTQKFLILKEELNSRDAMDQKMEFDPEEYHEVPDGYVIVTLLQTNSNNPVSLNIRTNINSYLVNNYGAAVNFSIIKDMVDREIDVHDDEISNLIPTPLYLGLAATMLGIIIGFFSMPDINNDEFTNSINSLIDGVKYAMSASLCGLLLTTFLSSFIYKNARTIVLNGKNKQLSYLQAKLLPALIASEETGIAGLKHSLDNFSKVSVNVIDKITYASKHTSESINRQLETIEKVENLKMHRVTKATLDLFERLESNVQLVESFQQNIKNIDVISERLEGFANKTKSIEDLARTIQINIHDSNEQLNLSKQLTEFLTDHFKELDSHRVKINEAVSYNEKYLEDAMDSLRERMDRLFNNFKEDASYHQLSLKKGYEFISEEIKKISNNQIDEYRKLYENSPPQFKKLEKLEHLVHLETLNKLIEELIGIDSRQALNVELLLKEQLGLVEVQSTIVNKLVELKEKSKQEEIVTGIDDLIHAFQNESKILKYSAKKADSAEKIYKKRKINNDKTIFQRIANLFSKNKNIE